MRIGVRRPEFVDSDEPVLELVEARHPCLASTFRGDFIPNSLSLGSGIATPSGTPSASCVLLTGPNMGGKSTLLRQTCLAVLIAQLVCSPWPVVIPYVLVCTYSCIYVFMYL